MNAADPDGTDNRWRTADDGIALQFNSPAINTGDPAITSPTTDITGYTRTADFDRGAYEYNPCTPTTSISGLTTGCGSVSLTANNGVSYAWTGGQTTPTAVFTTSGTYSVTATDAQGCTATASATVTVNPVPATPIITASATTICQGSNVTLTTTGVNNVSVGSIAYSGPNTRQLQGAPLPAGNDPYTIEVWVKPTTAVLAGIVGWGNFNTNEYNALRLNSPTQVVNYWYGNDLVVNVPNLVDGNWHHIAATFDGTTRSIYTDGVLRGFGPGTGHNVPNGTTAAFTKTVDFTTDYFEGEMDEFRVWNVGRTPSDILATMNTLVPINSPGLVVYFTLNAANQTIVDETGLGGAVLSFSSVQSAGSSLAPIYDGNALWTTGATTTSIAVSPTTTTTYDVTLTNTAGCSATASQTVTVNPTVTPSVSIAASPSGSIVAGTSVTFTATPTNGGTTPSYQWYRGITPVGTNSATYTDASLVNGNIITCELTSNAPCASPATATSNAITMNVTQPCQTGTIYVDKNATGSNNGNSWADAYTSLSDALAQAHACPGITRVNVAAGEYKPTRKPFDNGVEISTGDPRDVTFHLRDGLAIYGGYATSGSATQTPATTPTILSGDIGGFMNNSYHVVLAIGSTGVTVNGFTITGGKANGYTNLSVSYFTVYSTFGGGIYCINGTNSLVNNTILANSASDYGGGICMVSGTNALTNNILSGNSTYGYGGGVSSKYGSNVLINNTLINNSGNGGGAISTEGGANTVTNTLFWGNDQGNNLNVAGSDIYNSGSTNTVTYCLTQQNSTYSSGTGIINNQNPVFVNATNPAGGGLQLKPCSPAINTGTNTDAPLTDLSGTSRPQFSTTDIGAYESTTNYSVPTASISSGAPGCNSTSLTASGGISYVWSNGQTTATTAFTANGTYSVTATDAIGCTATASATVTLLPSPGAIAITGPTSGCEGSTIALAVTGTGGVAGNALSFSGSGAVSFPAVANIPIGNTPYTIEAWIKPTNVTTNGIVGWGNYGTNNRVTGLFFNGSSTTLRHYWWGNDLDVTVPDMADGNWHHVVATYNGTTRAVYTDGVLRGSNNPVTNIHNVGTAANLTIGSSCPACGVFNGEMDEVRIWNVGLTQAQILANMSSNVPASTLGLVLALGMNESSGNTADDETTNNNDGLIGAGVSRVPSSLLFAQWSNGATTQTPPPITLTTAPAPYTVVVTADNGCTATASHTVTVLPKPTLTISGLPACGTSVDLTANTNAPTVLWSGGANTALATNTITVPGTYSVTATSADNCTATASQVVAFSPVPGVSITPSISAAVCPGTAVTLAGPPPFSGSGINFTGAGSLAAYSLSGLPVGNDNYTIEVWAKPVSNPNSVVVAWGASVSNKKNALRIDATGILNYWYGNDLFVTTPSLADGNWHHVAATYNGTNRRIYLDGVQIGQDAPTGHNVTAPTTLVVGNDGGFAYKGGMDELRIWNLARTQAEIQANMNNTVPANSTGLVVYYPMNENTGTSTSNVSSSTYTATWQGAGNSWINGTTFQPRTYAWNSGPTTADITVSPAATTPYTLTATNAAGCTATATKTVTVTAVVPTAALATADITRIADAECEDGTGWTHYFASANNERLLSLKKNGNNIGTIGDGTFSVTASTTADWSATTAGSITAPYVSNPNWKVMNRWWNVHVIPANQPTSDVQVRSYFTDADLLGLRTATGDANLANTQLKFYKINGVYNPSPATGHTGIPAAATYSANGYWQYDNGTTSTSQWALGTIGSDFYAEMTIASFSGGGGGGSLGGGGAFPVEWLSFEATPAGSTVILDWITASEQNNASFTVERSVDGRSFVEMGTLAAIGNSSSPTAYTYPDRDLPAGASQLHYRIRQTDMDGSASHSEIRTVTLDPATGLLVYPNPATDRLAVRVPAGIYTVALADAAGRIVRATATDGQATTLHLDLSGLATGVYTLRAGTATVRVVKE